MKLQRRDLWGPLLAAALGLGGAGCQGPPLRVTPVGCAMVLQDGSCEVDEERTLRLQVVDSAGDAVVVKQEGRYLPLKEEPTRGDARGARLFKVVTDPAVRQLVVESTRAGQPLARRRAVLQVRNGQKPDWLSAVRRLLDEPQQSQRAAALLERQLQAPGLSPRDRALATGELASLHREMGQYAQARDELAAAVELDRRAGLLSQQIRHTLEQSMLLSGYFGRLREAEELLDRADRLVDQKPDDAPWVKVQRAALQVLRGQHLSARATIESGLRKADEFADDMARIELLEVDAEALHTLGWPREAEDRLAAAEVLAQAWPCWRGLIRANQGLGRLLALEARPLRERESLPDPRGPLLSALSVFTGECQQEQRQQQVALGLARAALADGRLEDVEPWLARSQGSAPRLSQPALEVLWLRGELRRLQGLRGVPGAQAQAQVLFTQLWEQVRDVGLWEPQWAAAVGRGRTAAAAEPALAAFRDAEAILDQRWLDLPFGGGHGRFLSRYEQGTAAHAGLLVRLGRATEALAVVRHARLRALSSLHALDAGPRLSPAAAGAWRAALAEYNQIHVELAALAQQVEDAAQDQQEALRAQARAKIEERGRALTRALRQLGSASPALPELPGVAPGEALLTCYPEDPDAAAGPTWMCLCATAEEVRARSVPRLGLRRSKDALAQDLLQPFADLLGRARRLRVIPYGPLQQLSLWGVPFGGAALEDALEVVYSLDLPASASAQDVPRRGLWLVDPRLEFDPAVRERAHPASAQLSRAGEAPWQLEWLTGWAQRHGTSVRTPPLTSVDLIGRMEGQGLLLYLGHGSVNPSPTWGRTLLTDRGAGLDIGQILSLQGGPRGVVLLACKGGLSSEERGPEGLGLAPAYLLVGADWVIAGTEELPIELSAQLAQALIADGASALSANPARQLRAAVAALIKQAGAPIDTEVRRAALEGLRVIVR